MNKLVLRIKKFLYPLKYVNLFMLYIKRERKKITPNSIVFVSQDLEMQGSETLAYHIVKELVRQGSNVVVISMHMGPYYKKMMDVAPVYLVSKQRMRRFAKNLKNKHSCNHVICNTVVTGNVVESFASQGYNIVTLVHELENVIIDNSYQRRCKMIASYSKCVVFPAQCAYESFCKFVDNEFNFRIKNQGLFLTEGAINDKIASKNRIDNLYGVSKESKIILNVATGIYRKGIDLFFNTALEIEMKSDNFVYIWVGPRAKKFFEENLDSYSALREKVILPGYIEESDLLNDFYVASDILFLSSREEPFGSVVLEAFKAGTPVAAFRNCGGFMDVVKDEETGYLIDKLDPCLAADVIINAIEDSSQYERISKNCLAEVKNHRFDTYVSYLNSLLHD